MVRALLACLLLTCVVSAPATMAQFNSGPHAIGISLRPIDDTRHEGEPFVVGVTCSPDPYGRSVFADFYLNSQVVHSAAYVTQLRQPWVSYDYAFPTPGTYTLQVACRNDLSMAANPNFLQMTATILEAKAVSASGSSSAPSTPEPAAASESSSAPSVPAVGSSPETPHVATSSGAPASDEPAPPVHPTVTFSPVTRDASGAQGAQDDQTTTSRAEEESPPLAVAWLILGLLGLGRLMRRHGR